MPIHFSLVKRSGKGEKLLVPELQLDDESTVLDLKKAVYRKGKCMRCALGTHFCAVA